MIVYVNSEYLATKVLTELIERIEKHGSASVADLAQMLNVAYTEQDKCRGWVSQRNITISTAYFYEGCALMLPQPVPLTNVSPETKPESGNIENVEHDNVNHPNHYKSEGGLEVIDVVSAFTDHLSGIEATDTGNILKYICRWKKKNGLEDLKKAQWYLNHLINHVEKEN